jgi:hypothetical protein
MTYVTNDRILLALSGPDSDALVTLERQAGAFQEIARVPAPGRFPLQLVQRPGTEQAVMPRLEWGVDSATSVYLLSPDAGGAYSPQGAVGTVAPSSLQVGIHPNGSIAYSPAVNPNDPVTSSDLQTTAVLYLLDVGSSGISTHAMPLAPRYGAVLAVDPGGQFLVLQGADYTWDPATGTPTVFNYVIQTVPLDAQGIPGTFLPESEKFPALLWNDVAISPTGHVILALEMPDDVTVPEDQKHPIVIRAQGAPGQWAACQTLMMPAAAHIAIAP